MRGGPWWLVLALPGVGGSGIGTGAEPDPEAVRRLMEKQERDNVPGNGPLEIGA